MSICTDQVLPRATTKLGALRSNRGVAVLRTVHPAGHSEWMAFENPSEIVETNRLSEVLEAFKQVEDATQRGYYAVGFLAYEAAGAFDSAYRTHAPNGAPLLWFGLYQRPTPYALSALSALSPHQECVAPAFDPHALQWQPSMGTREFHKYVGRIKAYIARGHTYQVNFSMRMTASYAYSPQALFQHLNGAQPSPYAAFINTSTLR